MLTVECVRRDDSGQEVLHMTLDITAEGDGKLSKMAVVFARGFGGAFFTLGNVSDAVEFVHLKSGELEEVVVPEWLKFTERILRFGLGCDLAQC